MAILPPAVSPRAALRDFGNFLKHREREHVIGAVLAILSTIIILILFFVDSKINTAPPARIVYVEQWSENRTDEEIVAQQKIDQAEREALALERQRQFQRLQDKLNIE